MSNVINNIENILPTCEFSSDSEWLCIDLFPSKYLWQVGELFENFSYKGYRF